MSKTQYVIGFMFSENKDEVLLIRKNKPEWQKDKLNGVGGHIEEGEWPPEAMVREFKEETNIETEQKDWEFVSFLNGSDFELYVYSTISDKLYDSESMTDEELEIFEVGELMYDADLIPNLKVLIPLALDNSGIQKPVLFYDGQSKE